MTQETTREKALRYGTYTFWGCCYVLIAASNFFSANASIDQIFFGTTLGLWLGFTLGAFLRRPLMRHTTKLLNGEYKENGYAPLLKNLAIFVACNLIFSATFSELMRLIHYNSTDW